MLFVHDIETTGLRAEVHRIVEIGSAAVEDGHVIATYGSLVNCGQEHLDLCGQIRDVLDHNHIPTADVLAARSEAVVAAEWRKWIDKYKQPDSMHHAYNNRFDFSFLRLPPWSVESTSIGECVMLASTAELDRVRWVKLIDSAAAFAVSFDEGDAHRADYDARKAAEVYVEILKRRADRSIARI